MKILSKVAIASVLGASAMALSAGQASAAIACAGPDCWHTTETYEYPTESHVVVHPDSWRWADTDHYTWREHTGRGYWRSGAWEDF